MQTNQYINPHEQAIFNQGYESRCLGQIKVSPSNLDRRLKSWWLAGWNTRDQELTNKKDA